MDLDLTPSCWGPFVMSANSETALEASVVLLCKVLKSQPNIDLHRLACTLQVRRTTFAYRASFVAADKEELISSLDSAIRQRLQYPVASQVAKASNTCILGVFTGQGAQWISMGEDLFLHSVSFRRTIEHLDLALKDIRNGPTWSLAKELLDKSNPERSLSAEISQPLCTAIQIALVDLLKKCGITFGAVVGHSSGEIAAAYSAGVLNAADAIVIAYYRGYHTHQAQITGSNSGKMMAVGMTPEDAEDICLQKGFLGRINVAAINSPSSVTLSGDSSAIDEVKVILDKKAIFARILKVDTAYHSHHMECVRESYIESLKKARILPSRKSFKGSCNWYSSVYDLDDSQNSTQISFDHTYWADNMTKPVLFSSAIISAVSKQHFDLALEIGPHPALKGPAIECIRAASNSTLPYSGVLERNKSSIKAFASALGFVWKTIDSPALSVDFAGFHKACNGPGWVMPRVHKNLPPYPWDHDRPMIRESKKSKLWRTRSASFHELLGYPSSSGNVREARWRNILKLADVEWLQGHQFQNQVLFPAAAYLAIAVKAAIHLFENEQKSVQLVELQDVVIHNAITLEEGSSGIETNLVIRVVEESSSGGVAEFYSHSNNADTGLPEFDKKIFTGRVSVMFGTPAEDILPKRLVPSLPMTDVNTERFYSWMSKTGLQYAKPFVLDSITRRLNLATVATMRIPSNDYAIHPATLDSLLQGLFAAFSYPGDGRMWTTYLPQSFRRVRFDIFRCQQANDLGNLRLVADCYVTESSAQMICGDIDVFSHYDGTAQVQIQGAVFNSLDIPTVANDKNMFWKTMWKRETFSLTKPAKQESLQKQIILHELCERTSYFYLNRLVNEIEQEQVEFSKGHLKSFMELVLKRVRPETQTAQSDYWKAHWQSDTLESIMALGGDQFREQIDLELIHHLGSRLQAIVRGSESTLHVLKQDNMLETLLGKGLGVAETNLHLGAFLDHLGHHHSRMRVLEIGAGTGASTSIALQHLAFETEEYTFTDLLPSYFQTAQARFSEHNKLLKFKALDIDQSPVEQGFQENAYDVIIATHVLQATKSVSQALQHCRQLLRPGGYIILLEPVSSTTLRVPFLLSALSAHWLAHEENTSQDLTITEAQWNVLLSKNHFSGVDHTLRDFENNSMHTYSVMISQAVDDRIISLRDPLSQARGVARIKRLLIIGGRSLVVSKLRTKIQSLLDPFVECTKVIESLEDVQENGENYGSAVVCLSGLEETTFASMNPRRVSAIQSLFREAKYIIWTTQGCLTDDPYANIAVGIGRSVIREMPHLRLKLVDIDTILFQKHQPEAVIISEMLLQMICLDMPNYQNILWSNETEVVLENGAVLVPRVVCDDTLNDRFNASRRRITKDVSLVTDDMVIISGEEGVTIGEMGNNPKEQHITPPTQVLSSSLFSFSCSDDGRPFYFQLSRSANTEQPVLVISETNGSSVKVTDHNLNYEGDGNPDEILSVILAAIIHESLFLNTTGTFWLHNPDDRTADIIYNIASRRDVPVFLTTSNSSSTLISAGRATYIHPRATERELSRFFPYNLSQFVDMGNTPDGLAGLVSSMTGIKVNVQQTFHEFNMSEPISLLCTKSSLVSMLTDYCSKPGLLHDIERLAEKSIIKVGLLQEQQGAVATTSIISWTGVKSIQTLVAPAATHSHLFADHKTYFLIGFAGEVGLSLCDWMTDHGAKYLAIASRNPAISPEVCRHLQKKGVVVRIFSMDVADMESLTKVYQEIISSMPPIVGVANAALVVRDHPFDSMLVEDLEAVFKPKVVGSQNLDNLFFSTPLDFFILFSSIASVVGKPGQSSYNAANLFMSTLAKRRRKRGLAASVMHFGMLLGFGYIHGQTGPTIEARFRQDDLPAIPEPDFHAIFAQAVLSGRPESNLDPEITAGLGTEIDTPWRAMSRFIHCRIRGEYKHGSTDANDQSTLSIQDCVRESCDSKQAYFILKTAIAGRVGLALGCPSEGFNENAGLISLGLDSLLAVEIRSWIFKILEVDVPVLKLLGGSSLSDICYDVLDKLPQSLKSWTGENENSRNEPYHENTSKSPISSQDPQVRLTASDTNSYVGSNQGNHNEMLEQVAAEELKLASSSLSQNIQFSSNGHQRAQVKYERIGDMSQAQAQLYFLHEYLQSNAYNVAYFGRFHGHLDVQKLLRALMLVSKRHEALRSAYFTDTSTGRPVQAVLSEPRVILVHETISDESRFQAEIDRVKDIKFDIENGVVMKVTIMSHSSSLHSIIFNHHHIALDGVAWNLFIADLAQTYIYSGSLHDASRFVSIQQPLDMVKRRQRELETHNKSHQVDIEFWKNVYKAIPPQLPLFPFSKVNARPDIKEYDYKINSSDLRLSRELTKLIEEMASRISVTPFHFYFASFATFLARCLGVKNLAIGVVNANRTEAKDMETIGYFLNMLPVCISLEDADHFETVARRSRDAAVAAFSHPHAPIDIVDQQSLFQVAINYRKASFKETEFGNDGKIEWEGGVPAGNPYDLLLNIAVMSDWTFVSLITQQSLYTATDGELLLKWYTRSLEALARDPSFEVNKCPISNELDVAEVIALGQGNEIEVPWKGTLVNRIDEMAAKFSDDLAIIDEQTQNLTYVQMTARTAQIMRRLQVSLPSIAPGSHIAMLLDPVADAICSILAIMRLGYVWVPLDTRNHYQRLRAVVNESRPCVLICHNETKELAHQISTELDSIILLDIDEDKDALHANNVNLHVYEDIEGCNDDNRDQPAMILYTSGSTGVPKGVVLTHGGLLNQINGTSATLLLQREITLQQSPLGFDLMLDQIFLALCNGGTIVMVNKSVRGDPNQIADLIIRHNVTLTHFVPSEYISLLNYGNHTLKNARSWRYAMSGGEKLSQSLRSAFYKLNCDDLQLINVYGPAEITLACARGIVPYRELNGVQDRHDHLWPSPNYDIEIVDANMDVLPVGFPGEICISGRGIGLGYLKRPEENRRKFSQRASLSSSSSSTIRVYRSGDKGRILPDGTLEVLGRLDGDSQVKIHGFRIELDEISSAIMHISNGAVVNAAISWRPGQLSGILAAFIVFDIRFSEDKPKFLEWLRLNLPLPQIMKPTFIVPIDFMPVTANGKTDRAAVDKISIPEPSSLDTIDLSTRVLNHWESSIREIWEEVLSSRTARNFQRSQVIIDHNSDFFQIGGNSILMIQLKYLLETQMGVEISMPELFHASTLSSMATLIADAKDAINESASSLTMPSFLGLRGVPTTINWDLEIASIIDGLPQASVMHPLSNKARLNGNDKLVVVMTGATGFIGKYLLSYLVQSPKVGQVHCLAIRPDASGNPRHVPVKSDKIVEYTGNLSDLNLGLSNTQFAFLAEHSHVIIHNGADVSLMKTYQSLRRANVISTRTLCNMAIPRQLPVHFISTASVAKVTQQQPLLEVPASPTDAALLNTVDGYAASKWVSETILERVATDSCLPVYIHRLAHVVGDDASELDAVGMMTKYSLLLRALPRIEEEHVDGQWDFVFVENVAEDAIKLAIDSATDYGRLPTLQAGSKRKSSAIFINYCCDVKIPHHELKEYLERTFGKPLKEMKMKEWLALARERGIHSLIYEFFLAFDEGRGKLTLPSLSKGP